MGRLNTEAPRHTSGQRPRSHLILRSIAWRAGSSAMFFAVAVVAVLAAAAGPVYLVAANQSIVASLLDAAPAIRSGITITSPTQHFLQPGLIAHSASVVPGGAGSASSDRFDAPIQTVDVSLALPDRRSGLPVGVDLVSRTGACAQLRLVSGHCPQTAADVILSTRSAREIDAGLGSTLTLGTKSHLRLSVVGLYAPGNATASFWWGLDYFPYGTSYHQHSELLDDGFMTAAGAQSLVPSFPSADWVNLPLRPKSVSAAGFPALVASVDGWAGSLHAEGASASTGLQTLLSQAESSEHVARTIVAVVSLELVLLALLVLYWVSRSTSAIRAPDVQVAELRGLPRARIARLVLRDSTVLLLAALPCGLGLTYLLLSVVDRAVLGRAAGASIDSLAVAAAGAAVIAGFAATTLASRSLFVNRRREEAPSTRRQRLARNAAIADALAVGLAAAGVAELVGQSGHRQATVGTVAYLAPGLTPSVPRSLPDVSCVGQHVSRRAHWNGLAS